MQHSGSIDVSWIQATAQAWDFELTSHAEQERQAESISVSDIRRALMRCDILEDYPHDERGASCLVLGLTESLSPIHLVCARTKSGTLRVVTVYRPSEPKWIDPWTRGGT